LVLPTDDTTDSAISAIRILVGPQSLLNDKEGDRRDKRDKTH